MNQDRTPLSWIALGAAFSVALTIGLAIFVLGSRRGESENILFEDDFETGLALWTARPIGHNAQVVADPLGTRGNVVNFTSPVANGDIFTPALSVDPNATYVLSFDYLGVPTGPVPPGGLGGFIGISDDPSFSTLHAWLAGTQPDQATNLLIDDGAWHSYEITFAPSDYFPPTGGTIRIMLEDFEGSGAYAADAASGDAYFDNIRLVRR